MRVFEALCSGSLLVTDSAPGSGLEEFFQDNEHLVIFNEENLIERIRFYLEHPEERLKIAQKGRKEVLARHTYDHRAKFLLDTLDDHFKANGASAEASNAPAEASDTSQEKVHNAPPVPVNDAPAEAIKTPSAEASKAPLADASNKPGSYYQNVRNDLFPLIPGKLASPSNFPHFQKVDFFGTVKYSLVIQNP